MLLPFSISYLWDSMFSTIKIMKSKHINRLLHLIDDLRVGLSIITLRIDNFCRIHQGQAGADPESSGGGGTIGMGTKVWISKLPAF